LEAATTALEAAAPARRPKGLGGLSYEVVEREVGDWGRSFLGCDRRSQLVLSRSAGQARIAGRATADAVDRAKKTF
jgi:hypothetical protein